MTVKVRFAPSPTGYLHIGNARVALVNWLFARKHQGEFCLRLDDTDTQRSEEKYDLAIREDMAWLGLTYDTTFRQSDRLDQYVAAKNRLIEQGRLYPCYESAEELDFKRKRALAQGKPPVYDRTALKLTDAQRQEYEEQGRKPHWRFLLKDEDVRWHDLVRGDVHYHVNHMSDPVLIREDGTFLYTLSSVLDDLDYGVTHVMRGEDHVTNTAVQIQLYEALGGNPAHLHFAHLTLLVDAQGQGLSKRLGSLSLRGMRDEGIEPMAINSLLARLGTSLPVEPKIDLEDLIQDFDLQHFSRTPPRFDMNELSLINRKLVHHMPFSRVQEELKACGATEVDESLWLLIRENLAHINEAKHWQDILLGNILGERTEIDYLEQALACLPEGDWDVNTWKAWTDQLKTTTGRKGKELFMPLRLALTGMPHGPEMKDVLPRLGRDKVIKRLRG